jgi:hypothetical protein
MDIKTILQEKFKEHLSESSLNDIVAAFESVVQEKVSTAQAELIATNEAILEQKANELAEQRAALQVESALLRIDEEHSAKLQHLLESIDADHTAKLQNFIDVVDADHTAKLQNVLRAIDEKHAGMLEQVVEKYETALQTEAVQYKDKLIEEVSNYLELYIEKLIPTQQISEAVENIQARRIVDQIRELVSIDEHLINSEIK